MKKNNKFYSFHPPAIVFRMKKKKELTSDNEKTVSQNSKKLEHIQIF